jgi:hypothetical protein
MKPITDPRRVEHYGTLLREMILTEEGRECEFNPDWVLQHDWKIVPVESAMRIPDEDIPLLVSALKGAGYTECFAVFNEPGYVQRLPLIVASEPPSDMSTCYVLSVDEGEFREFNRQLGPFRSVLAAEDRSWAISCNEWYNLFGAKPKLLEALLGKPIAEARREFFDFASMLAQGKPDEPLLRVAKQYAAL